MDLKPDPTAQAVVPVLACVLNQLTGRNDRLRFDQTHVTKFHALRPPNITIRNYLERVMKYAGCSGECFVLALIYVDRIIQTNPAFVVNSLNIHRLLITSVMLAAKFFDDQYFNNGYYAKVGGVPCGEVNHLEVEFLFMINFNLYVATDNYVQYYTELVNHVQHSTGCQCGTLGIQMPRLEPRLAHLRKQMGPPPLSPSRAPAPHTTPGAALGFRSAPAPAPMPMPVAVASAAPQFGMRMQPPRNEGMSMDTDSPVMHSTSPPVHAR